VTIPPFSDEVVNNGYRWWYVDAHSDDHEHAITLILFVGSVFSPYYAAARRNNRGIAGNFCALNVALYGPIRRWAMTERSELGVHREAQRFKLKNSSVCVTKQSLTYSIDEWSVPIPQQIRGTISIDLPNSEPAAIAIDSKKEHFWQALAPQTRITVELEKPALSWSGTAYVDSNTGVRALEDTFLNWHWSRAHLRDGSTVVQYDTTECDGAKSTNTWQIKQSSMDNVHALTASTILPKTPIWRIHRSTRTEQHSTIEDFQTLEDTPFYARSRYRTMIAQQEAICMHESLDLKRFSSRWVQCLLPFRMPRRPGPISPHRIAQDA